MWYRLTWIEKVDLEKTGLISVFVQIGGSTIQGTLTHKILKKGVWGMQREIEKPVKVIISGAGSDDQSTHENPIVAQNILSIYREELPQIFNNIRPDENQFDTISVNLRVHLDAGNKIEGLFLAALTCLYIFLEHRKTEMDAEIDHLFPLNYSVLNKESKPPSPKL